MGYYAGLDLHRSMSVLVVKDRDGRLIREGRVANDPTELQQFFAPCQDQPVTIALEATTHYTWMYDTLEALGHTVQLAHPLKVRAIASARIKTDRIDAGILCDLLRGNLLPTSYVPPPPIRMPRSYAPSSTSSWPAALLPPSTAGCSRFRARQPPTASPPRQTPTACSRSPTQPCAAPDSPAPRSVTCATSLRTVSTPASPLTTCPCSTKPR